ncbi:MAG: YidC/Oxa1 family membrane protein insertase [bacterium]
MIWIWDTIFYNPLYNLLVYLIDVIPNHDAGIAVVLVTLVVSFLLFSISKKAIRTQLKMKEIEPELKKIKETIKDKQEQSLATLALYKKNNINPFSGILMALIQIPVLFALYYVFYKGGLPTIHSDILYGFIKIPLNVNMNFLGIMDIGKANIWMAIIAGIGQFTQAQIVSPKTKKSEKGSMSEDFAHSMNMQMKYVFPVIILMIGAGLPSALPLYWASRSIFMSVQEFVVRRKKK